jgi:hypothetical protein
VSVVLRDYRMMADEDDESRPLRYASMYGELVAKML